MAHKMMKMRLVRIVSPRMILSLGATEPLILILGSSTSPPHAWVQKATDYNLMLAPAGACPRCTGLRLRRNQNPNGC